MPESSNAAYHNLWTIGAAGLLFTERSHAVRAIARRDDASVLKDIHYNDGVKQHAPLQSFEYLIQANKE